MTKGKMFFGCLAACVTGLLTSSCGGILANTTGGDLKVDPAKCAVVISQKADARTKAAAADLQKHLKLITDAEIPLEKGEGPVDGKYSFVVGAAEPGSSGKFAPEEARWVVTPGAAYLYGDDSNGRNGSSFAVHAFLEESLEVHWIEPGDDGIVYKRQSPLVLREGSFGWIPKLPMRTLRAGCAPNSPVKASAPEFKVFEKTMDRHNKDASDTRVWQARMRMGNSLDVSYGHAFTKWWEKYGKTHPEYFALNKFGKRAPETGAPDGAGDNPVWANLKLGENIKVCPSNPGVAKQIIDDWLATKPRPRCVNVCENDDAGYCRCAECRKLDGHNDDIGVYQVHLTDRYIHLLNAVAREAKKHDPDASACTYAYNETEQPPRRERLEPNIVMGMVPTTLDLQKLAAWYEGWKKMGATKMFLRPNYSSYYYDIGVPTGLDKQLFDAFQLARKNGCVGTDYDSLAHQWDLSGINDYILAKANVDPSQPFEKWEDEYCSAFGDAAGDVKEYFRHWRNEVWEKRTGPDFNDIVEKGKYHNFVRGLMWNLSKYYKDEDFDNTDAILKKASEKNLAPAERKRLGRLVLSNQHARLVFKAITTKEPEKFKFSKELLEFRIKHKDDLRLSWLSLISNETRAGDVTGLLTAAQLGKFALPWIQTPLFWQFKMDPENKGLAEEWQKKTFGEMNKSWAPLPTNSHWESAPTHYKNVPDELRAKLKNYDGIGWYAQEIKIPADWKNRKVCLCFGAVDESCQIYVNGDLVSERPFSKPDDWITPFDVRIDHKIDWTKPSQTIVVRVEDKAGGGGIWKRVWLASMP